MMTYYIDIKNGRPDADGQSPENARSEYRDLPVKPGDIVLFRRGNVIREPLRRVEGTPDAYVTYGAWGEGAAPLFTGTIRLTDPDDFRELRPNLWECTKYIPDEVCNFIFNKGGSGGTLRWSAEDVKQPGDWYDSRIGTREAHTFSGEDTGERILLCYVGNPVCSTSSLEIVPYGERYLSQNVSCTALEDLAFWGSGVHALSGGAHHMTVRRCSFGYIGGAVWNKELKIRFGNAVEFWNLGEDILIEDCYFNNIYDSCITHQGSRECTPAKNLVMRGNLFVNYGMAAYEGRDLVSLDSSFCGNICTEAGGGFTGFGDTVPRRSEIYPRPMGHHVFLWRQEKETPGGSLVIENNLFGPASGAAVYSVSSDPADRQQTQKNNIYDMPDGALCCRRQSEDYTKEAWAENREEGARFEDADIPVRINEWFARTRADRMGMPVYTDMDKEEVWISGTTDKDAVSYRVGEKITFSFRILRGGKPYTCREFRYHLRSEDGKDEKGTADGKSGSFTLETVLSVPGTVMVTVKAYTEAGNGLVECTPFEGGAVAGFEDVSGIGTEPDDLDAYWEKTIREELDPVSPVLLSCEECDRPDGGPLYGDRFCKVKIACPGPMPVSGYLRIPGNAQPGKTKIAVGYCGYGVYSAAIPPCDGTMWLCINQIGFDNGLSVGEYQRMNAKLYSGYGCSKEENSNPDTSFYKYLMFRALQAIRYLKSRPEWDGKNVKVQGGSMGGFQSIFAAAWDRDVTEVEAKVPWMCDRNGLNAGRFAGWVLEGDGLEYFDTVYHAKRVTADVRIEAGLGDGTCPPSGIAVLYHNLKGNTELRYIQNRTHVRVAPDSDVWTKKKETSGK